jgi:CRP-like cAMP-binding protein
MTLNEENRRDLEELFAGMQTGRRTINYSRGQIIFSQDDPADAVFFVQEGQVKLVVVSLTGKEATLSVMGPQEFFGVGCLGNQNRRLSSAVTMDSSVLIRFERDIMIRALREHPRLLDAFLSHLLDRTIGLQRDLCTQMFDSSEKRLIRVLLKLTRLGEEYHERIKLPKLSHDFLATMVGTTRSRITYFMNKFRRLGLIDYGKGIVIDASVLSNALEPQD